MKINVVTLCSGYDSQCMALDRIKEKHEFFDYELVAWCEYDPMSKQKIENQPAVRLHNAVYPQWKDRNLGDMTKVDWSKIDKQVDLLTYSTPCTDISNAGLQKGLEEGSGTRSSILWNVRDAIKVLKPKYLLMENVKALVQKKFMPYFLNWIKELEEMGYKSFYKVLNATEYGVAQNRERIFCVSIRDDGSAVKFNFPKPFPLTKVIEDYLEDEEDIPESYYLSQESVDKFVEIIQKEDV